MIEINRNPTRRDLAVFGVCWMVFFGAIGAWMWHLGYPTTAFGMVWCGAVGVPVLGWWVPGFMRLVSVGLAYAAFPIGFVVSFVLLAAVYYLILTPVGLVLRLFGYDPLKRCFDAQCKTYWVARAPDVEVERYFQQF